MSGTASGCKGSSVLQGRLFMDGASTIFYLTPFRVFEFCIGALVATLPTRIPQKEWTLDLTMGLGLFMIGYAIFSYDEKTVFPSYNALIPCLGTAVVIVSAKASRLGFLLRHKAAVTLGLISYSVYLVHWPLIVFYKYYIIRSISEPEKAALVAASVVFGYFMYRWVERPFRHSTKVSPKLSIGGYGFVCVSLLIILTLPAATVWANKGWPWRSPDLPKDIALQIKDSKQFHVDQYGGEGFPEPTGWINEQIDGVADIVLIGDSHAAQLKTGLKEAFSKMYRKSIYFSTTSCLTLPGITRITPGNDWDSICPGVLSEALFVLDRSPGAILLIAESWDFQVSQGGRITDKRPLKDESMTMKDAFVQLLPSLDQLKRRIGNRKLVIIGSRPCRIQARTPANPKLC